MLKTFSDSLLYQLDGFISIRGVEAVGIVGVETAG